MVSALYHSIHSKDVERVKRAIAEGAAIEEYTFSRESDLVLAIEVKAIDIVKLLLEHGASVKAPRNFYTKPVKAATYHNAPDILCVLLDAYPESSDKTQDLIEALVTAACYDHVECAQILLETGLHVDSRDSNSRTALMHAAANGSYNVAKLFLQYGADVNAITEDQFDALAYAVCMQRHNLVKLLLDSGCSPNSCNNLYKAPILIYAIKESDSQCVQILLEAGAEPFIRGYEVGSSLMHAVGFHDYKVVSLFISAREKLLIQEPDRSIFIYDETAFNI